MSGDILKRNFFELFDLPVAFDIDEARLQQAYMALQKQVHPDRFASAPDAEKRLSMQQTSHINEALATLKDPVQRAAYLLKLKGLDIQLQNETTMDAAFLMQQMELRERLDNVRSQDDPLAALDEAGAQIRKQTTQLMQDFSAAYEADDLEAARECIRKLQFLQKAKNQIDSLSADIEDELLG